MVDFCYSGDRFSATALQCLFLFFRFMAVQNVNEMQLEKRDTVGLVVGGASEANTTFKSSSEARVYEFRGREYDTLCVEVVLIGGKMDHMRASFVFIFFCAEQLTCKILPSATFY